MNCSVLTVSRSPERSRFKYPIGGVGVKRNFELNQTFGKGLIIQGILLGILGVVTLATPGLNTAVIITGVALLVLSLAFASYGYYVYKTNRENLLEEAARPFTLPPLKEGEDFYTEHQHRYRGYLESGGLLGSHLFSAAQSKNTNKLVALFAQLQQRRDEEIEAIRSAFKEEVWEEGQPHHLICRWVNHLLKNKKGAIRARTSAEFAHFFAQIGCQ